MATIISLKRRIQAAQNVSKTTRVMQMISASKLKKAQNAALATRPYVERLGILTARAVEKIDKGSFSHPYIKKGSRDERTLLVVIAPDKGLCGGLITNLLRRELNFENEAKNYIYLLVGKKIESYFSRTGKEILASFNFGTTVPTFDVIYPIMNIIDENYSSGKVGEVKVLYTEFSNFFSQTAMISPLLPVTLPQTEGERNNSALYIFEPGAEEILPALLRHNIEMSLYQYFLESFASEQASRMLTMQNATNNANDIIEDLRLDYNITRQAKITGELLDITGAGIATA